MSIPYNKSIANPSPGHYDTRNDLGYGRTSNSGLGSTWNMGDALSAPKGEWDDELEELDNDEDIDDIDIKIHKKIHVAFNRQPVDSYAKKGTDPYSFNGLANTSQYLGASHKRSGDLIEAYVREVLLSESGISGKIAVQKSGLGNMYKTDNSSALGGTKGGVGGHKGAIDTKGYGQKGIEVELEPYVVPNEPTNDGGETTYEIAISAEDHALPGESNGDFLNRTTEKEFIDMQNVINKHINNRKHHI